MKATVCLGTSVRAPLGWAVAGTGATARREAAAKAGTNLTWRLRLGRCAEVETAVEAAVETAVERAVERAVETAVKAAVRGL